MGATHPERNVGEALPLQWSVPAATLLLPLVSSATGVGGFPVATRSPSPSILGRGLACPLVRILLPLPDAGSGSVGWLGPEYALESCDEPSLPEALASLH
jgi:hypothetical protein